MLIYTASSWKNQHAVEMLRDQLRARGHVVMCFVEQAVASEGRSGLKFDVDQWIASEDGARKFAFDTDAAMKSDLVIYIGPAGTDAWAEIGAAYARGRTILGLYAKGEPSGLMRRMVRWHTSYAELLSAVDDLTRQMQAAEARK